MNEEKTKSFIANFLCKKDDDIEYFLHNKAIEFETKGKSRTFLVYDEDKANVNDLHILGYFSLAISILEIPGEFSNNKIKKMDGLAAKKHGEKIKRLPAILIGQFAKNDTASEFCGEKLMDFCLSKVMEGQHILGGRVIMLECKNEPKLIEFYKKIGFTPVSSKADENSLLVLNRILQYEEITSVPE